MKHSSNGTFTRMDKWKFGASLFTLLAGIALIFMGVWLPPIGAIDASIEIVVGEILGFVGAVWGVDTSYSVKTRELEYRYRKYYDKPHHGQEPEHEEPEGEDAESE